MSAPYLFGKSKMPKTELARYISKGKYEPSSIIAKSVIKEATAATVRSNTSNMLPKNSTTTLRDTRIPENAIFLILFIVYVSNHVVGIISAGLARLFIGISQCHEIYNVYAFGQLKNSFQSVNAICVRINSHPA